MWALVKEGLEDWFSKNAQMVNLLPLMEEEMVTGGQAMMLLSASLDTIKHTTKNIQELLNLDPQMHEY